MVLKRQGLGPVLLLIILAGIFLAWRFPINTPSNITALFGIDMVLLTAFALVAGKAITGMWFGILIDDRNKISLSRLQMALWTLLILSGLLVAVLLNIHREASDPLAIALDPALWTLMGISTASFVGSPLIKASKRDKPGNQAQLDKTVGLLRIQGVDTAHVEARGQLVVNEDLHDARWTDLFKGEEIGNAAHLDFGKMQMFYFTLIVWFAYMFAVLPVLQSMDSDITEFPTLSTGMLTLLGISHAGYLTNKAIPHTS